MSKLIILNQIPAFPDKVNFIDDNDVFVGYDLSQQCCEYAYWQICEDEAGEKVKHENDNNNQGLQIELDWYVFDTEFFKEEGSQEHERVIFRLKRQLKPDLYLILHNQHNGYYSHGFTYKTNQAVINGYI